MPIRSLDELDDPKLDLRSPALAHLIDSAGPDYAKRMLADRLPIRLVSDRASAPSRPPAETISAHAFFKAMRDLALEDMGVRRATDEEEVAAIYAAAKKLQAAGFDSIHYQVTMPDGKIVNCWWVFPPVR